MQTLKTYYHWTGSRHSTKTKAHITRLQWKDYIYILLHNKPYIVQWRVSTDINPNINYIRNIYQVNFTAHKMNNYLYDLHIYFTKLHMRKICTINLSQYTWIFERKDKKKSNLIHYGKRATQISQQLDIKCTIICRPVSYNRTLHWQLFKSYTWLQQNGGLYVALMIGLLSWTRRAIG